MDYFVTIDDEATSEGADNLSLVGTVNGVAVACVVRLSQHPTKEAKLKALVKAYLAKVEKPTPKVGAEKVTV